MRLPGGNSADAVIFSTFLLPFLAAASGSLDCNHIRVDNIGFNLSKLGGPRSVVHNIENPASSRNTTYTIDICKPLRIVKSKPADIQCPNFVRICAITHLITKNPPADAIEDVFPIAGELRENKGGPLAAKWERLKNSSPNSDSEKEGLRIEMNGGFKFENEKKKKQKAIVEFECDRTRTGLENLPDPEDQYREEKKKREERDDDDKSPSLEFLKYKEEGGVDVLRLRWRTKYACEDSKEEQDKENGQSWGFFTWFIIVAFLSTATYLIFGSWLNYNRYGARGWDLLPHGDTIRDVPYLLKDWIRRVLNTVQGGGSRGGYAAV